MILKEKKRENRNKEMKENEEELDTKKKYERNQDEGGSGENYRRVGYKEQERHGDCEEETGEQKYEVKEKTKVELDTRNEDNKEETKKKGVIK